MSNRENRDHDQGGDDRKIPLRVERNSEVETPDYQRGYEAAFAEIYAVIDSGEHPRVCSGICRVCGVTRTVIEDMLQSLAKLMTAEEYETMVRIVARIGLRRRGDQ